MRKNCSSDRKFHEHDEISYRIGDQAGVENRPLMWPTSLSISPLSSWYSLKFRYFKKATNIWKISLFYLAHVIEQPNFRIPYPYINIEIFVLIFLWFWEHILRLLWDLERIRKGCVISIYKLQSVSPYCLIKHENKILGIRNSDI